MVGKPNQKNPVVPLKPIPAFEEPFSKVIIDCVGPLPKTKSRNQYLLTIMCTSIRYPEAIPLNIITAPKISRALINFFALVGLPKEIQSNQIVKFYVMIISTGHVLVRCQTDQISVYHPESQGTLEMFHSTLKNMIRTYCLHNEKDGDEGISLLLFAVRESFQESLGFGSFELFFGHSVCGPVKLLKENWLSKNAERINLLDFASKFRDKLKKACELAQQNLKNSQSKMDMLYDRKSQNCIFKPGDKVLVLLPVHGNMLQARYHGPYKVLKKVGDLVYVIETPERRKSTQLCHVDMVKPNFERGVKKPVMVTACNIENNSNQEQETWGDTPDLPVECKIKLSNSEILDDLKTKLNHVPHDKRIPLIKLLMKYKSVFLDVPNRTNVLMHNVDVGNAHLIKQQPYLVNPIKLEKLRWEVQYMLDKDIIEPNQSSWASPCILVPKPNGSMMYCTDYRKINVLSKMDSFPIPRMENCIGRIGNANYITKCDLLKGHWCVPLTEWVKEISAIMIADGACRWSAVYSTEP